MSLKVFLISSIVFFFLDLRLKTAATSKQYEIQTYISKKNKLRDTQQMTNTDKL